MELIPWAKVGEETNFKHRVKIAVTVMAHGSDLETKHNNETNKRQQSMNVVTFVFGGGRF